MGLFVFLHLCTSGVHEFSPHNEEFGELKNNMVGRTVITVEKFSNWKTTHPVETNKNCNTRRQMLF